MKPTQSGYYWVKFKGRNITHDWTIVEYDERYPNDLAMMNTDESATLEQVAIWGPRILTPDEPVKIPKNFIDASDRYQGCVSQGFCDKCKVFTYGSPCLCMGDCYLCGNLIKRDSYGDLDGVYKTIDVITKKEWYQVYEKGKYVRTIQDGLTYLLNGAAENVDFDDD